MKLEDFKAGVTTNKHGYKSFSPTLINNEWTWNDAKINTLLAEANLRLGELNAFSAHVPDVDLFIRMHVVKEATTSSRIEGTQTEMDEAVLKKADVDIERRDDWQEVQNYISAMNSAISSLKKLPISTRLLRNSHKSLMSGVRGRTKLPGEFRKSQNWIGGATINDATFVPPHHSEISQLMGDLEKFLHNDHIHIPALIRIAIAHYQFETIHPFLDGNGRVGRLLITLYLVSERILTRPTLYLSAFFDKHRQLYYDNLEGVRKSNGMLQWIIFFLVGVTETATEGIMTFRRILALQKDIEEHRLISLGKRVPQGRKLLKHIFASPAVTATDVGKALGVTPATANGLIADFVQQGILREVTGGKRNRLFVFREYLDLFMRKNK